MNSNPKKFVFVQLAINSGYHGVNHGIAGLLPIVKKYYEPDVIWLDKELEPDVFLKKIDALSPVVIAFSATFLQLKYLTKYSNLLANRSDFIQIAGGSGPTCSPELFLQNAALDGVFIGEAEHGLEALLQLLQTGGDYTTASGFYWKTVQGVIKNRPAVYCLDINQLAAPDYTYFPRDMVVKDGVIHLQLSRGCPNKCPYCANHSMSELFPDKNSYVRHYSTQTAIDLIKKTLIEFPEANYIYFDDDMFVGNKENLAAFTARYTDEIGLPFTALARVEQLTPDVIEILHSSGCQEIALGIESGSEQYRKEYLKRAYTNEELVLRADLIMHSGMKLFTFNVIGFPFETPEQMRETLELNKLINPSGGGVCSFFYPFPGTKMYRLCQESDLLPEEDQLTGFSNYNTKPAIKMSKQLNADCLKIYLELMMFFMKKIDRNQQKRQICY